MRFFFLSLLCLNTLKAIAQSYQPGQTYFSADSSIEYRCGNMPLIITAPHGGYLEPEHIPSRTCPDAVTVRDGFTQELARVIDSVFGENHGCRPHLIINRLHRIKLDPNRELGIATCDSPQAAPAWTAFHLFTDSASALVERNFGKGLLLDIHGHAHSIQRLELGYQLTGEHLRAGDSAINSAFRVQRSGIRSLVINNLNSLNHVDLLRGNYAFGTLLHQKGYNSVPSQQIPFPLAGEPFFSGAYITERHGSMNGGTIDAVQLEHQMTGVRDNAANRRTYADTLRRVILEFLQRHYFGDTSYLRCNNLPGSVKAVTLARAKIYPNPAAQLFIETEHPAELQLFDLHGRFLTKQPLQSGSTTLDFTPPQQGLYLIRLSFPTGETQHFRWVYNP